PGKRGARGAIESRALIKKGPPANSAGQDEAVKHAPKDYATRAANQGDYPVLDRGGEDRLSPSWHDRQEGFKLADLLALLALIAAAFFFFAPFVMHDMPRGLGFAGVWGFGSLFCLLVAWHVLPDSAHRHLIGNGPWFVILGGI